MASMLAAIGVICVGQHLPRLAAQAGGDASDRRRQLFAVIGGLRHFHVHDQRLRRISRDLHVVVGRDAAVGLPHPARFRFTHADPRSRLAGAQFLQFFESLLQPLLPFPSRSPLGLFHPAPIWFLIRVSHFPNPSSRSFQVFPDLRFPLKAAARRLGLDLGPVLHHLLQRDQSFRAHQSQHLREQLI